MVKKGPI